MGVASRFKAACQAVLRRQFVGEALVLDEAVLSRVLDGLLIELQDVGVSNVTLLLVTPGTTGR